MEFIQTKLLGAYVIEPKRFEDERGYFATIYSRKEFESRGLQPDFVQTNLSQNTRRGCLRGMHFQRPPSDEVKLVRCGRGAVFDAIVDLRPESSTFCQWIGVELSEKNNKVLYVPRGFAHGYLTLTDDAMVVYQVSAHYSPAHAGGVRYDDPRFGIEWPIEVQLINDRDRTYPDFMP
ncbi:MAG: dTDP-4-dehydrorhamnose 3,5-epimerase [Candidatus Wallbacteria bacterium]|nr:dTDP-4-dehydrorhamnose 3,5-epimerase [Candidatus Wallbacteria bacterium]